MDDECVKLKQYLLGDLSPSETEQIDLRIIEDEGFEPAIAIAECDLIEEYLDGSLSAHEHKLFEANFLISPERKGKLSDVALLKELRGRGGINDARAAGHTAGSLGTFFRNYFRPIMAGAAAVAVIVAICVWQVYFSNNLTPLEAEYAMLNSKDLSDPVEIAGLSTISLVSGSFRDANSEVKEDSSSLTDKVLFRLALPRCSEAAASYRAKISRGSSVVFSMNGLRSYQNPDGIEVRAVAPRSVLPPAQYQINLKNAANNHDVSNYSFTISR